MASAIGGKLVLVTGASSGIGRATAELFAERGARLILLARNTELLEEVAAGIRERGAKAAAFSVDLSQAQDVEAVAERIRREQGIPDIVVNNAGAGRWLPLVRTSLEEGRAMIELPYLAAFYVTRVFLPEMLQRGSGQIGPYPDDQHEKDRLRDLTRIVHRLAERLRLHRGKTRP